MPAIHPRGYPPVDPKFVTNFFNLTGFCRNFPSPAQRNPRYDGRGIHCCLERTPASSFCVNPVFLQRYSDSFASRSTSAKAQR